MNILGSHPARHGTELRADIARHSTGSGARPGSLRGRRRLPLRALLRRRRDVPPVVDAVRHLRGGLLSGRARYSRGQCRPPPPCARGARAARAETDFRARTSLRRAAAGREPGHRRGAMKIYAWGEERDATSSSGGPWPSRLVVVGATPERCGRGFRAVGSGLPGVPASRDAREYALARTDAQDRARLQGYAFHASPEVTSRTTCAGRPHHQRDRPRRRTRVLVDPHGGAEDVGRGILRT